MSEHNAADGRADLSPHTSSVWLPAGTQRTVLIDAAPCPDGSPAVVEICFDSAGDVVARMDGDVLGHFDAEASADLSPSLRLLEARGLVALARGSFTTVDDQPALTIHADPLGAPRSRANSADAPTESLPIADSFAADQEAEAAVLAADASTAPTTGGSTVARTKPQSRNLQAVTILSSALAIGLVGILSYYYGLSENGREMTAFTDSTEETAQSQTVSTSSAPSSPSSESSASTTSSTSSTAPSSASDSEDVSEPAQDPNQAPEPAPNPNLDPNPAPAPAPAPAPNPNPNPNPAPPPNPNPNPAPPPAPAPAPDNGGNGGGADNAPNPQPIFELQW